MQLWIGLSVKESKFQRSSVLCSLVFMTLHLVMAVVRSLNSSEDCEVSVCTRM